MISARQPSQRTPANGRHAAQQTAAQLSTEQQAEAIQNNTAGVILQACLHDTLGKVFPATAFQKFRQNLVAGCGAPSDPIALMMIDQLACAHFRLCDLHTKAAHAESVAEREMYNTAVMRLMAEFRKLALALREYRQPVVAKQVTVVQQQNLAAGDQQIAYVHGQAPASPPAEKNSDNKLPSNALPELVSHEPTTDFFPEPETGRGRAAEPAETRSLDRRGA